MQFSAQLVGPLPEGLELGDPAARASDEQKYVKTCGMFARNGAESLGVERQDVYDIPVEYIEDSDLRDAIGFTYMLSSASLVTMTVDALAEWTAKNIAGQMTRFIGDKPLDTVVVLVILHTGETAMRTFAKVIGQR